MIRWWPSLGTALRVGMIALPLVGSALPAQRPERRAAPPPSPRVLLLNFPARHARLAGGPAEEVRRVLVRLVANRLWIVPREDILYSITPDHHPDSSWTLLDVRQWGEMLRADAVVLIEATDSMTSPVRLAARVLHRGDSVLAAPVAVVWARGRAAAAVTLAERLATDSNLVAGRRAWPP